MSQDNSGTDEVVELPEIDTRDERELVELFDALSELKESNRIDPHVWDIEVTSPEDVLDDEQCEQVKEAVLHTIGAFRGIVGNDKYIPSGVYWSLVSDYADEFEQAGAEDWAEDLEPADVLREIVFPTEMSRYYGSDPVANFFALYHSRQQPDGWSEHILDMFGGHPPTDAFENEKWTRVLGEMAFQAMARDVVREADSEITGLSKEDVFGDE